MPAHIWHQYLDFPWPTCVVCGTVQPRDPVLQARKCRGPVRLGLRLEVEINPKGAPS